MSDAVDTLDATGADPAILPIAVVFGGIDPAAMVPTVRSIQAAHPGIDLVFAAQQHNPSLPIVPRRAANLASLLNEVVADDPGRDLLVVHQPVIVPPGFLDRIVAMIDADMRIGVISFLSNDAAHLSFPERNQPSNHQIADNDEASITERLRRMDPPPEPVIIHAPAGGAAIITRWALSAEAGFVHAGLGIAEEQLTVADHALRVQRRGFVTVLDSGTFVSRAYDLALAQPDAVREEITRAWLHHRHPTFPLVFDQANDSAESSLGLELRTARAKIKGLQIAIDGSCLGPIEMGTQVQTMSLVAALAARDDVASVTVGIPGAIPGYARQALDHPRIELRVVDGTNPVLEVDADIIHRPFQPDRQLPWEAWERWAARTVVTVQDVIAYQIGNYQPTGELWRNYRRDLRRSVARADGVVVISEDVVRHLRAERLPIDDDRLAVIGNGTDHLSGAEPERMPPGLSSRLLGATRFLLVLGANYSHKNRDLALLAHARLRDAHPDLALVLVGAMVPHGSSRALEAEAMAMSHAGPVAVLPDVSSEERNWLLRHAEAVVYPTAAEGFGLVPFEAARFGTPTVEVPFGPLREILPDLPVVAADWSPRALADALLELLGDPALADAQLRAITKGGEVYRWSTTAAGLVRFYRQLLSHPTRLPRAATPEEY